MLPNGCNAMIMAAIREEREREAMQANLIKQCLPPDGKFELLVRNLEFGFGQALESFGEWLQKQAADQSPTDAIEFTPKEMNYG